VLQVIEDLLDNDRRILDADESLPRERSECFGYDFVTANVGEFSRVPGLKVENWLRT